MKVSGLDLSMTGTGLAVSMAGAPRGVETQLIQPREVRDRRLGEIKRRVMAEVAGSDFVLIEALTQRSYSSGVTGMVHGVIRDALLEAGIRYGDLLPAALKKFATGRGNASKAEMMVAALKRGEMEFREDNQCDAWWLWVAAHQYLGEPIIELPKAQRDSLAGKIQIEG